jgi:glucose/arabinose dehydrogenase
MGRTVRPNPGLELEQTGHPYRNRAAVIGVIRAMGARTLLPLLAVLATVAACGGDDDSSQRRSDLPRAKTITTALDVPWEIAFLPDGHALITERPGRVLAFDGYTRELAEIPVEAVGEGGLLGLAIDPAFQRNGFVYLYRTTASGNEVARYRLVDGRLDEQATLVTGIAAAAIHDGGRLRFGPDERLYISTGDASQPDLAQDPASLNGKILRLEPEQYRGAGGRPEVFSLGHRNVQGFDWQPGTGRLYASEHGAAGNDEINLLRDGANYGWPRVEGEDHDGFTSPLAVYNPAIAPSGATFVHDEGSAWHGDFLVACLGGEQLRRLRFDGERVTLDEALYEGEFGRLRSIVEGPDGALYLLTNNTDGRGSPREGDDRLIRIVPPG